MFRTKMELGAEYGMAGSPYAVDRDGDGRGLGWYAQEAAFSGYVVGRRADEAAERKTETVEGYEVTADEALLSAGDTIGIRPLCTATAQADVNAR